MLKLDALENAIDALIALNQELISSNRLLQFQIESLEEENILLHLSQSRALSRKEPLKTSSPLCEAIT